METLRRIASGIRAVLGLESNPKLSPFQVAKLLHEFNTFYDMNGDGRLQWKDFEMARDYICEKSGWKLNSAKWKACRQLFTDLWRNLLDTADENTDGEVTAEEWLQLWSRLLKDKRDFDRGEKRKRPEAAAAAVRRIDDQSDQQSKEEEKEQSVNSQADEQNEWFVPVWVENYIEYKFSLLDRAGDGVLDIEEFEYTLNDSFNIPPKDCQTAFRLMTKNGEVKLDRQYFRTMALEFYFSNDPCDLGNFINGKLIYD